MESSNFNDNSRPPAFPGASPLSRLSQPAAGRLQCWRQDIKWLFAIPFTLILGSFLLVLVLFQLTGVRPAQQTITAMNRPLIAGSDSRAELSFSAPELLALMDAPNFAADVYRTPRLLGDQIATLTSGGPTATAPPVAAADQSFLLLVGIYGRVISLIGGPTHAVLVAPLIVLLFLLLVLGLPMLWFSRGWGRLVSLGACFAAASWLPLIFLSWIKAGLNGWLTTPAATGSAEEQQRLLEDVMRPLAGSFFNQALSVYRLSAFVALLCLAVAAVAVLAIRQYRTG